MMRKILLPFLALLIYVSVANAQCFPSAYAETRLHLLSPQEVQAFNYYESGRGFINGGKFDAAIDAFETALELDPAGLGIAKAYACDVLLRDLAYAYRTVDDIDNALRVYYLTLDIAPDNWTAAHEIIEILKEKEDYQKAIKFLKERIELNDERSRIFRTELIGVYLSYQASKYDFEREALKDNSGRKKLPLLEKAWEHYIIDIGEDEANVLKYLDGGSVPLGYYLDVFGETDRAIEFYSLALRVSRETLPGQEALIAKIENRLRQVQNEKERKERKKGKDASRGSK